MADSMQIVIILGALISFVLCSLFFVLYHLSFILYPVFRQRGFHRGAYRLGGQGGRRLRTQEQSLGTLRAQGPGPCPDAAVPPTYRPHNPPPAPPRPTPPPHRPAPPPHNPAPPQVFGWHALCMGLFVAVFTNEAVLSFVAPLAPLGAHKGYLITWHVAMHVLALAAFILGLVAIVSYKVRWPAWTAPVSAAPGAPIPSPCRIRCVGPPRWPARAPPSRRANPLSPPPFPPPPGRHTTTAPCTRTGATPGARTAGWGRSPSPCGACRCRWPRLESRRPTPHCAHIQARLLACPGSSSWAPPTTSLAAPPPQQQGASTSTATATEPRPKATPARRPPGARPAQPAPAPSCPRCTWCWGTASSPSASPPAPRVLWTASPATWAWPTPCTNSPRPPWPPTTPRWRPSCAATVGLTILCTPGGPGTRTSSTASWPTNRTRRRRSWRAWRRCCCLRWVPPPTQRCAFFRR